MKNNIIGLIGLILCTLGFITFTEYLKIQSESIFVTWCMPVIFVVLIVCGMILMTKAKWIDKN